MLVSLDKAKEAVNDCLQEAKELRNELDRQAKVSFGVINWSQSLPALNQKIGELEACATALTLAVGDTIEVLPDSLTYKAMMAMATT